MTIETIKHQDVRGKELLYMKLTNRKGKEYLINVGIKTFETVTELLKEEMEEAVTELKTADRGNGASKKTE